MEAPETTPLFSVSKKTPQIYKPCRLLSYFTALLQKPKLSPSRKSQFCFFTHPVIRIKSAVTKASYSKALKPPQLTTMAGFLSWWDQIFSSFPVEQRSLAHQLCLQALVETRSIAVPERWDSEVFETEMEKRARSSFQRQKTACFISALSSPNPISIRTLSLLSSWLNSHHRECAKDTFDVGGTNGDSQTRWEIKKKTMLTVSMPIPMMILFLLHFPSFGSNNTEHSSKTTVKQNTWKMNKNGKKEMLSAKEH